MFLRNFIRIPPFLLEARYRRYWFGRSTSLLGDQISEIALPMTAILILNANANNMGILRAAALIPGLLFSIHAGAWVDRIGQRRRVMIVADLVRVILLTCISVSFFLGTLNLPELYIIMFLLGTFSVLFNVSNNTVLVSLIPKEQFVEANSLIQRSRAIAYLAGPTIGSFLIQLVSAPVTVTVDAVSFVVSALTLSSINPEEPPRTKAGHRNTSAGVRFLWNSSIMRFSMATMATLNLFDSLFMTLYMLYAIRLLHLTPVDVGTVIGFGSVGAVLASGFTGAISKRIGLGRSFFLGTILFTSPLLVFPMAHGSQITVVGTLLFVQCVSAFGLILMDVSNGAIRAAAIPDSIRSGVMGSIQFINKTTRLLGAIVAGTLPTIIGLHATIWVAAVGASLGFLWIIPSSILRCRDWNDFVPNQSWNGNSTASNCASSHQSS